MQLPGIITNVTKFGAFVDIGVHQDGLVHVSELADRFVKDPADVVKVQQKVTVTVLEVDPDRKRISLSMRTGRPSGDKRDKSAAPNRQEKGQYRKKPAKPKNNGKLQQRKNQPFHNPLAEALGQLNLKR